MNRDVLALLWSGSLSVEEVEAEYDSVIASSEVDAAQALGLNRIEWTAFCHGVPFHELATWRYRGWPQPCPVCGKEIVFEQIGWFVQEVNGGHSIYHVSCLNANS